MVRSQTFKCLPSFFKFLRLHFESNLSLVYAEDKNNNALPLIPQTKLNTMLNATINNKGKIMVKNVFLQHIYKFKQEQIGQFETPTKAYNLFNLGIDVNITTKNQPIEISTGVKNLFNVQYIDHLSRFKTLEIPNQGINFFLSLKLSLNKKLQS